MCHYNFETKHSAANARQCEAACEAQAGCNEFSFSSYGCRPCLLPLIATHILLSDSLQSSLTLHDGCGSLTKEALRLHHVE